MKSFESINGYLTHLRPLIEADAADVVRWRNDPEVNRFLNHKKELTINDHLNWFHQAYMQTNDRMYLIEDARSKKPIGTVSIYNIDIENSHAEWGRLIIEEAEYLNGFFAIDVELAILKHAFNDMKLHKLYCTLLDENTRLLPQHKNFGFVEERVARQHIKKGESFHDLLYLSILEEEFRKQSYEMIEVSLSRFKKRLLVER